MISIPIGPFRYQLQLVDDYPADDEGRRCFGLTDPARQRIIISRLPRPSKRIAVCWHEIGHAIRAELDPHIDDVAECSEEAMCNLIGLAMTHLRWRDVARVHMYVVHQIPCTDVMVVRGIDDPIPIIRPEVD